MNNFMKSVRPQTGGGVKIKQGYYNPVNPIKYIGEDKRIIYRSSLELRFMRHCDTDPNIIRWQSEPEWLEIKYINPFKRRMATYYPDFYIQFKSRGKLLHLVIEIKADTMMSLPEDGNISKMSVYVKKQLLLNLAKKEAAEKVCAKKGWRYLVITDKSEFFHRR